MDRPIWEGGRRLAEILAPAIGGDGPLYREFAEALKRAIDRGEIPLGTVLPPERALAKALAVSRSTVVAAYDRLKVEGWIESRQGSGTWVRRPDEHDRGGVDAVATAGLFLRDEPAFEAAGSEVRTVDGAEDLVDLSVAAGVASPAVLSTLRELSAEDVVPLLEHHGYLPHGLTELREVVAQRMAEGGLPTDADQLLATVGAHQAISLIVRQTVEAGDSVLVESPTFPGALDIFRRFGARTVPLPVDGEGMRTEALADLVDRLQPKLAFVTSHFHNPTGCVLAEDRRREIAEVSDATGLVVIEDVVLADLALDDVRLPPPIASYARGDGVHVVGSASKLCWAGLRVGWIRSPAAWSTRMLSTKTVADLGGPVLDQLFAARMLANADRLVAARTAGLRAGRDLLCALLRDRLPEWELEPPPGGLALWVHLPQGNAIEFTEIARRHGVAVIPGPALSVDDGNRRAVRIVFDRPAEVLERGVERLVDAWKDYRSGTTRPSARLLV